MSHIFNNFNLCDESYKSTMTRYRSTGPRYSEFDKAVYDFVATYKADLHSGIIIRKKAHMLAENANETLYSEKKIVIPFSDR